MTNIADQKPCCLPGQQLNPDQSHGPCKPQSPCQCEDSVSHPTAAPTPKEADAPTTTTPDLESVKDSNYGRTMDVVAASVILAAVPTISFAAVEMIV